MLEPGGKKVFAVMGMDFSRSDLKKYLDKQLGGRLAGNGVDIYLIDSSGFVLLDMGTNIQTETGAEHKFVGTVNENISKTLRKHSLLLPQQCANYQSQKVETHFTVELTSQNVALDCEDGGSVKLAAIPGSQIFVLVNDNCKTNNADFVCAKECPAHTQASNAPKQVCPCESELGYFICDRGGRFESQSGVPVCAQKPPETFFTTDLTKEDELKKHLFECGRKIESTEATTTIANTTTTTMPNEAVVGPAQDTSAVTTTVVIVVVALLFIGLGVLGLALLMRNKLAKNKSENENENASHHDEENMTMTDA